MTFFDNLKDLCLEKNLTIKMLAKLIGIQDSLLYKYVNHNIKPTVKNLVKISDYFQCSIDFLLGIDEMPNYNKIKKSYNVCFYDRFTTLVFERKLTNYKISRDIGISDNNWISWKKGGLPYLDTLIKLADYFGVSIDYLLGRSDEM